jgi:hypothetical protein
MPVKLTISKVPNVSNFTNSALIKDFYQYMVENDSSKRNQNNYLKVIIISFAMFLGVDITFYEIKRKEQIITQFLDSRIKRRRSRQKMDYHLEPLSAQNKHLFRWFYNQRRKEDEDTIPQSEWITPVFAKIKQKKTKIQSLY